jgi:hypothetical protein
LSVSIGSSVQGWGAWIGTPEGGDAIGGGPSRGVGAAADDGGDVGVGQPGEVVVGDGLFLLGGQLGDCLGEFAGGVRLGVAGDRGLAVSGVSATGIARLAAARVTSMALR